MYEGMTYVTWAEYIKKDAAYVKCKLLAWGRTDVRDPRYDLIQMTMHVEVQ